MFQTRNRTIESSYLIKQITALYITLQLFFAGSRRKLQEQTGAFTEDGLRTVIIVVVGGIILTLLVLFVKNVVFPTVENKVNEFFSTT